MSSLENLAIEVVARDKASHRVPHLTSVEDEQRGGGQTWSLSLAEGGSGLCNPNLKEKGKRSRLTMLKYFILQPYGSKLVK